MLSLQVSPIPYEIAHLCSLDIPETRVLQSAISEIVRGNEGLRLLCQKVFREYSKDGNIEAVVQVMGWKSFRDRLTGVYLFHKRNRYYPDVSDLNLVQDIVKFENRFQDYSTTNNSRTYLLGMYLRFLEQDLVTDGSIIDGDFLNIPSEIDTIIKLNRKKSEKLDYIILFVWHLISFVGPDKTAEFMEQNDFKFKKIFEKLDDHFKRTLIGNFLNYSSSIHQTDLFVMDEV